jgi:N utilization substance protein B
VRRRTKARRWTLQILYAWEVRGPECDLGEQATDFFRRRKIADHTRVFSQSLVDSLADHIEAVDEMLEDSTENWDLDRLAIIDRNILRIALAEFLYFDEIPFRVTIDEAVTLAKRYGGAESPRFVNGVLDALAHKLDLIPS